MASKQGNIFNQFPKTFWVANTIELFERWAWYGMYVVLALYLTGSTETGALGFSQVQKGNIMGIVTAILYLLPVITGALADKFGYKKMLLLAFGVLSSGYLAMGYFSSYAGFFIIFMYVGIGASLFKPVVAATVAKTTTKESSSIGFGIFYMMVNIGAFIGPIFASKLREWNWKYVFVASALAAILNFILVLFFYKEPEREKNADPLGKSVITVLRNIVTVLKDIRFTIFVIIIIGFWTMYNQLFYTLPVFIDQWVDTRHIYEAIASFSVTFAGYVGTPDKTIAPEMMTNIDAGYIILFQVLISAIVMKFKPLNTMISGIFIAAIGLGLTFVTQNGFYLFITILVFGVGEMASSPKITEYIGRIAPKNKVALYIGTSYLPMAGGNFFAGVLSGTLYGGMSDKITLLRHEVASRGLQIQDISAGFTQNDYIDKACSLMVMNRQALTDFLWNKYSPSKIWMVFTAIGVGTALCLFLYDRFVLRPHERKLEGRRLK